MCFCLFLSIEKVRFKAGQIYSAPLYICKSFLNNKMLENMRENFVCEYVMSEWLQVQVAYPNIALEELILFVVRSVN